jgi:hypothetical protein
MPEIIEFLVVCLGLAVLVFGLLGGMGLLYWLMLRGFLG